MKRIVSFFLALCCVLSLAACAAESGKDPADTTASALAEDTSAVADTSAAETEPAVPEVRPNIPDTNWEGKAFRVLGDGGTSYVQFANFEILSEETNGETLNDAIWTRNNTLSERYNVTFEQTLDESEHHTYAMVSNAVSSGEDRWDLVFIEYQHVGSSTQAGHLLDMKKVQYIDFTQPYWNQNVTESTSIGDKVYFAASDYSLRDKNRVYIMVYNTDLAEANKLPDVVSIIRDNKWTLDKMGEFSEVISSDLDGDGKQTDQDRWGIVMDSYNSFNAFWTGADNACYLRESDGTFVSAYDNQHSVDTIDKLISIICNTNQAGFCDDFQGKVSYDYWGFSTETFYDDRALILTCFPHSLEKLSQYSDANYTVIPFPKFDESQQEYITMPDPMSQLFAIPVTTNTPEFTGFMLEALSCESTNTSLKAYYDVCCKTKFAANPVSAEMLDVIFDGIRYDIDKVYGLGFYGIINSIAKSKANNTANAFAKMKKAEESKLNKLYDTIGKLDH